MKRLISATLALTLLSGTAAVAAPTDHGRNGYNQDYRGDRGRSDNSGAIVAGVGLLAIAAILASQSHSQHGYHQGWYSNNHYGHNDYRGYGGRRW